MLGLPGLFVGLFGFVGVISGTNLTAGLLGIMWSYLAAVGAYELNRRKFDWERGRNFSDLNLLAGTLAVSTGLVVSGAFHETMPVLAIVPAVSAIVQANDGHSERYRALIHITVLLAGMGVGIWFYADGIIGSVLLDWLATLP